MTTPNTIVLVGELGRYHREKRAAAAITPGMLLEVTSLDKYQAHSVRGGRGRCIIAKEDAFYGDALTGKTIDSAYASSDLVFAHEARTGDRVYALIPPGENISVGDAMVSYGNGTFAKAAAGYLANNLADSATVTNTTAETTFSNGTVTIPANTLKAGDQLRIRGTVRYPSTNSTDTAAVTVNLGATALVSFAALDVANADVMFFDVTVNIRTIGASGTFTAFGTYSAGVLGTATSRTATTLSTAIDTTVANTITVKVTWSVASTSNQAILSNLVVEEVSAGVANGAVQGDHVIAYAAEAVDNSAGVTNARCRVEAA